MRKVSVQQIQDLQKRADHIRNVCILAHVDHGKTTLADSLIASNGIISQRMAGKLRYMDNRKDEQERGITMKSSAIALYYDKRDLLVNLIDSPGHVDFTSEVVAAVRLCDGAALVVDVVEGVCAQTKVALQLAWSEHLKPLLVLNKIDRLILEKKLTPLDAYVRLSQVLEQVNAVVAELFTTLVLSKTSKPRETSEAQENKVFDWSSGLEEADDSTVYFSPEQGNVMFASAYDGWGFSVEQFADLYAEKLGVRREVLQKTLWGDFYLNTKTKRIQKGAQAKAKKPLFAQMVLENIWDVYEAICVRRDQARTEKIASSLGLQEPRHGDPRTRLQSLCSQWMPLAKAFLEMLWRQVPSPKQLNDSRAEALLCPKSRRFEELPEASRKLKDAFLSCSPSDDSPTIVCISKMVAVDSKQLPENRSRPLTLEEMAERREQARKRHTERMALASASTAVALEPEPTSAKPEKEDREEEDTAFVAFARVFSGTLRRGQKLFVLGPKHDPAKFLEKKHDINPEMTLADLPPDQHVTVTTVDKLYLLMGRDLEALEEVPAGNVLGIGGLEKHVGRTATLSTDVACPPFVDVCGSEVLGAAILRVALEPRAGVQDVGALRRGLKLLHQADPCAQVLVQETGEHVLLTAGEVHLERCLHDLVHRFARIEIDVSDPIVPFRETIVEPPKVDMVNEATEGRPQLPKRAVKGSNEEEEVSPEGVVTVHTSDRKVTLQLRAMPLPSEVTRILEEHGPLLKDYSQTTGSQLPEALFNRLNDLRLMLEKAFKEEGREGCHLEEIWALGPRRYGPNALLNRVPGYARASFWPTGAISPFEEAASDESDATGKTKKHALKLLAELDHCIVNGFQLATLSGPLCQEPMMGVAFALEGWAVHTECLGGGGVSQGPLSGQLISAMKDGCRRAFEAQPQRLMCAMYTCAIQVNSDALRQVYAVLGRRHGRVLGGDMHEGSTTFDVTAVLPVVESFHFANEMRKQTSGLANPQLVFSHWEVVDVDPFWVPSTEEEYLHFGEKADTENRARKYVDEVRRRKGLPVAKNVVERAEKQRTLSRKK